MSETPKLYTWPDGQVRTEEPYRCGAFITGTGEQCTRLSDHDGDHRFPFDDAFREGMRNASLPGGGEPAP